MKPLREETLWETYMYRMNNIKMDLNEIVCWGLEWVHFAGDTVQ
jgi:hypothetical protein